MAYYDAKLCPCLRQMVACILITAAAYGKFVAVIETVTVMSGLVVCGVLLLLVSIVGLIGAVRHNQVLLFFVSFLCLSQQELIDFF